MNLKCNWKDPECHGQIRRCLALGLRTRSTLGESRYYGACIHHRIKYHMISIAGIRKHRKYKNCSCIVMHRIGEK